MNSKEEIVTEDEVEGGSYSTRKTTGQTAEKGLSFLQSAGKKLLKTKSPKAKLKFKRFKEKPYKEQPDLLGVGVKTRHTGLLSYNSEDYGIPRRTNEEKFKATRPTFSKEQLRKMLGL